MHHGLHPGGDVVIFSILAQQQQPDPFALTIILLISAILSIIGLIILWTIYEKAGEPGWAAIVPIYNLVVFLRIVGRPTWWLILLLIPGINAIIGILLYLDLAKVFGQGTGFAVGLILLSPIFLAILAFGDAKYVEAVTAQLPPA